MQQAAPVALIAVRRRRSGRHRRAAQRACPLQGGHRHGSLRPAYQTGRHCCTSAAPKMVAGAFCRRDPDRRGTSDPANDVTRAADIRGSPHWRNQPATGRFHWTWTSGCLFAGFGALTGFMTGLSGVGGGFVIVPAMRCYTDVSMHGIVATSLLVIALVGSGGIVAAANGAQRLCQQPPICCSHRAGHGCWAESIAAYIGKDGAARIRLCPAAGGGVSLIGKGRLAHDPRAYFASKGES